MNKNKYIENLEKDYRKYRWFFTYSKKLVVGGKNAKQNDYLLNVIKESGKRFKVMHTSEPGSSFSVILIEESKLSENDLRECAVFTACFSRAWKLGRKETDIDIFSSSQLHKEREMKEGTWGVIGKVEKMIVPLELILTKQKNILKAIPELSSKNNILLKLKPGKLPKEDMVKEVETQLGKSLNKEELLSALPTGGFKIYEK
ncbi:DUF814 domain-containing protein [Candidatus Pacearchaeota archaeon]|nr:DUF814 domain-containing protein [Candidatus Pacearchaeota archaeon]